MSGFLSNENWKALCSDIPKLSERFWKARTLVRFYCNIFKFSKIQSILPISVSMILNSVGLFLVFMNSDKFTILYVFDFRQVCLLYSFKLVLIVKSLVEAKTSFYLPPGTPRFEPAA
jgi:hypothetical protein